MGPDCTRHRFSIIVLSNFLEVEKGVGRGLSGVFLPKEQIHPDIAVSAWGRPRDEGGRNGWSGPTGDALTSWECRSFVAELDPLATSAQADVRIFAFSVQCSVFSGYPVSDFFGSTPKILSSAR